MAAVGSTAGDGLRVQGAGERRGIGTQLYGVPPDLLYCGTSPHQPLRRHEAVGIGDDELAAGHETTVLVTALNERP